MSLNDQEWPLDITSGHECPVNDLFIPLLKESAVYNIAVGYFTSGWLRDTAEGMAEFALSGGRSRWIVSTELQGDDAEAIVGNYVQDEKLENQEERSLIEVIYSLKEETRKELCALIASGVLEFRIAVPKQSKLGLFHAKVGVAIDSEGNKVGFSGSYNLTAAAKSNWEHINVFKNWSGDGDVRIVGFELKFEGLWENTDPTYATFSPSKELIKAIGRYASQDLLRKLRETMSKNKFGSIKLRSYQETAISSWGKNHGRGTYVMATGSGKTITALATAKKLVSIVVEKNNRSLFIVVVVPLKHLLEQWNDEATEFGFETVKCYENSDVWHEKISEKLGILRVTGRGHLMALVTNATFAMDRFQSLIKTIEFEFMIIADEAHNLGSSTYLDSLPENAGYRLALTATPDRYNDPKGTRELLSYFGTPVIDFTLADAINEGYLCPYKYYPHLCLMSESEYEEYLDISILVKLEADKSEKQGEWTKEYIRLVGKRTDLISGVESKLDVLNTLLKNQIEESGVQHTLVYCGSRRGEDNERHIERTVKVLGSAGIKTRKFTSEESMEERREILDLFSNKELEAIAAIKCLDEGVDIPATRVAYILASTANPKEHIQRRGRVLRKAKGKDFAVIHDFLVAPPPGRKYKDDMIYREIERAREFGEIALNNLECSAVLNNLMEEYGVRK